jgi:hypothetical protein
MTHPEIADEKDDLLGPEPDIAKLTTMMLARPDKSSPYVVMVLGGVDDDEAIDNPPKHTYYALAGRKHVEMFRDMCQEFLDKTKAEELRG